MHIKILHPSTLYFVVMNWLDKKWEFGIWQDVYDDHLQILKTTPERIHELIAGIPAEKLILRTDGKWSVNEHIGHLLTMESLWIARLDDLVLGHKNLRPWNGTNEDTEAAGFNRQRTGKILEDLEDIRLPHYTMLQKLKDKSGEISAFHERLQTRINLADHVMFIATHDQHHLNT
ncbi:MAG: DinB family protein, partial [Flavobacteriales bacterium]|nr:DinB family protein [Flavobacteriales bacterium]